MDIYDTVELPQWAIGYLEYGDDSALSLEDIALIGTWVATLPPGALFAYGSVNEFCYSPVFGMPCGTFNTDVILP